jgi:hypothetical protein
LRHGAPDKFFGLIYQRGKMMELQRGGPKVFGAERGEDEEEPEGGIAEDVVGNGCHEGEEEGEHKVGVGGPG